MFTSEYCNPEHVKFYCYSFPVVMFTSENCNPELPSSVKLKLPDTNVRAPVSVFHLKYKSIWFTAIVEDPQMFEQITENKVPAL